MRLPLYSCVMLILFILSCNSASKDNQLTDQNRVQTTVQYFSNTIKPDTFRIELQGSKPKEMALLFNITADGGAPVYAVRILASDLLDNYKESVDLAREKKQKAFMEQELKLFFEEENFLEPAVTEDEQADKNTPDKEFFEELRKSGLNGFKYRLGKETKVYVAWSEKEKKVKPYYECCK